MKRSHPLENLIRQALREDIAAGDVTSLAFVPKDQKSKAVIFAKSAAVLCGAEVARQVFLSVDPSLKVRLHARDGQTIKSKQNILTITGSARSLLSAERVALNFLSYLSAVATKTSHFVRAVKPYKVRILDTRKTTPTLRPLERYAVRCGGGFNHRDNLHAMMLIKDNHLAAVKGTLAQAIDRAAAKFPVSVEVEVDTLDQLREVLQSRADMILLDNMRPAAIRKAVAMRRQMKRNVLLEASGGITLKNVRQYAEAGVDRISIGELTHSRQAIDFSMEIL